MQFPPEVERWRPLVAKYFPPELVDKALWVIMWESGGNPRAQGDNGVAIGLFQIHDNTSISGRPTADQLFDPEFNVRYAALNLGAAYGNWKPWGEGVLYKGQKFGALGFRPFPGDNKPSPETMRVLSQARVSFGLKLPDGKKINIFDEAFNNPKSMELPNWSGGEPERTTLPYDERVHAAREMPLAGLRHYGRFGPTIPGTSDGTREWLADTPPATPTPTPGLPRGSGRGAPWLIRDVLNRIWGRPSRPATPSSPATAPRPLPANASEWQKEFALLRAALGNYLNVLYEYAAITDTGLDWNPLELTLGEDGNIYGGQLLPPNMQFLTTPPVDDKGKPMEGWKGPGVYVVTVQNPNAEPDERKLVLGARVLTQEQFIEYRKLYSRYVAVSDYYHKKYGIDAIVEQLRLAEILFQYSKENLAWLDAQDEASRQRAITEMAESMAEQEMTAYRYNLGLASEANDRIATDFEKQGFTLSPFVMVSPRGPNRDERVSHWRERLQSMMPATPPRPRPDLSFLEGWEWGADIPLPEGYYQPGPRPGTSSAAESEVTGNIEFGVPFPAGQVPDWMTGGSPKYSYAFDEERGIFRPSRVYRRNPFLA